VSWLLTLIPGRLLAELAILGVLLGSTWFCYDRWQSTKIDFVEFKATIAAQGAAQALAVKAREDAQERANASTIADLQAHLADSDSRGADLARRLRQALAHPSPLPPAQGIPPVTPASGAGSPDTLTADLGAAFGECYRNADRLDALIHELEPQL